MDTEWFTACARFPDFALFPPVRLGLLPLSDLIFVQPIHRSISGHHGHVRDRRGALQRPDKDDAQSFPFEGFNVDESVPNGNPLHLRAFFDQIDHHCYLAQGFVCRAQGVHDSIYLTVSREKHTLMYSIPYEK